MVGIFEKNDVYDNTKIIIASDHGMSVGGNVENAILDNGNNIEAMNCVLMIKDFGRIGSFTYDDRLSMNADVPALAFCGTVEELINPFTGKEILLPSEDYGEKIVTCVSNVELDLTEKTFDTSLGSVWKFSGQDIYDHNNWELVS